MKRPLVISENAAPCNSGDVGPSRRSLLIAGAAGAAGGLANCFWGTPAAARAPGKQEKLKLGFVGVGNFGINNIAALADEEITGLCDVDEDFLGEMGQQFPKAKRFVDWRKMLEELALDGVVISTPDHQHTHVAIAAMKLGRHVYCEKPLTHSIAEGQMLSRIAESQRAKVVTQLGIQHHPTAGYWQVQQLIRSGALGEISEVHCWTAKPTWPQGELKRPTEQPNTPEKMHWDLWLGPAPERPYHSDYAPIRWRAWWDFGTGSLGDMGPHLFDPVAHSLDLSPPTSIVAECAPVTLESAPAWCIVRWELPFAAGLRKLKLVYYDGGKRPPMEVTGNARLPPDGTFFIGSKGRLFAPQRGERPFVFPTNPNQPIPLPELPEGPRPSHHQEWADCCRSGKQASVPFWKGARLCEIPLLGNIAIRSGKRLTWDVRTTGDKGADSFLQREYRRGWEIK